ncbi:MAG: ABC transporter substrate-binding protein [Clostridia bacterium]|nr:ABC transporter substrate-binding protein [Clostridia bacterium]
MNKRRGSILAVSILLVLALATAGVGSASVLDVYSIWPESFCTPMFQEFTAKTGIKINFVRHSSGEVLARIIAEKDNPRVGMVFGGPADTFAAAVDEGVLESYFPTGVKSIPEDPKGFYTGIALNPVVLLSNRGFLADNKLKPPASWNDLLSPVYRQQLQMADARTSGTGVNRIMSLIFALGSEDAAYKYMKELDRQVQVYTKSGGGGTVPVGTRQAGAGVFFLVDCILTQQKGYDVAITFPKEGSVVAVEACALVKNGKNHDLAKRFLDWLVTAEAQSLYSKHGIGFMPTHPSAKVSDLIEVTGAKLFDLDLKWAADNRQRLIDRWVTETLGQ